MTKSMVSILSTNRSEIAVCWAILVASGMFFLLWVREIINICTSKAAWYRYFEDISPQQIFNKLDITVLGNNRRIHNTLHNLLLRHLKNKNSTSETRSRCMKIGFNIFIRHLLETKTMTTVWTFPKTIVIKIFKFWVNFVANIDGIVTSCNNHDNVCTDVTSYLYALVRVLFWCLLTPLRGNELNKHQNNPLVSAFMPLKSTYLNILYLI